MSAHNDKRNWYQSNIVIPLSQHPESSVEDKITFLQRQRSEFMYLFGANDSDSFVSQINELIMDVSGRVTQAKISRKPKPHEPFHDFLLHTQKVVLAEALKDEFKTERGKELKTLLAVLTKYQIINISDGKLKTLYTAIKEFLNRDIGTYEAFRKAKVSEIEEILKNGEVYRTDENKSFKAVENRVRSILDKINNSQQ